MGQLPEKISATSILTAAARNEIDFSYVNARGDVIQRRHRFEGILPNLERRYRETESHMVREELAQAI